MKHDEIDVYFAVQLILEMSHKITNELIEFPKSLLVLIHVQIINRYPLEFFRIFNTLMYKILNKCRNGEHYLNDVALRRNVQFFIRQGNSRLHESYCDTSIVLRFFFAKVILDRTGLTDGISLTFKPVENRSPFPLASCTLAPVALHKHGN